MTTTQQMTITVRITRTRMAIEGRFYAYDVYVPGSELSTERLNSVTHYSILDSDHKNKWVSLADALRPELLDRMPRGIERYEAYQAHSKACDAIALKLAQEIYPELTDLATWPTLWIERPDMEASHDSRYIHYVR